MCDVNDNKKLTDLKHASTTTNHCVPIDERSRKGQFGWFVLGNSPIPLIYRNGNEEYCSVRMAEQAGLNSVLKFLNKDIFTCINVKSYDVTPSEGLLLNHINFMHCDGQFGRDDLSNDLIVKVSDVIEFYEFLSTCYAKLTGKQQRTAHSQRFGFILIDNASVVPYSVSNGRKYVPLFYFEGEIGQLELKSCALEGWDLCYLKFCCKIQGIRSQLYEKDTCAVIDLEDVKTYFPPETTFEEYWVPKFGDSHNMVSNKTQSAVGGWIKKPTPQSYVNSCNVKSQKANRNFTSNSQLFTYLYGS